jgi:hypothetical protein
MTVMNDIAGVLTSQEDCAEVGFTIPPPTAKAQSYEHGEVTFDDSFALLYFKYVFGLISNRVVGELWWLIGWPPQSAMLVEDTEATRKEVAWFKKSWENYQKFEERADMIIVGVKALVKRSIFNHVSVQQLVQMFILTNWEITDKIRQWCSERWRTMMQTQICEDGFNREKRAVQQKQMTQTGREVLSFDTLINSDVMKIHKFTGIQERSENLVRGEKFDDKWIHPTLGNVSIATKGLVSTSQTASFESMGRKDMHVPHTDFYFMDDIVAEDAFNTVRYAWLGGLFCSSHLTIVRKMVAEGVDPGQWVLPMKHAHDSSVLCWPVAITGKFAGTFDIVTVAKCMKPQFITVTSLDCWEARPISVLSPLGQLHKAHEVGSNEHPSSTIVIVCAGPVQPFISVAAKSAFWSLTHAFLKKLAGHLEIDVRAGASLFQLLFTMVDGLVDGNEEEILDIISKRLGEVDGSDIGFDDILELDDAAVCLDENDRKVANDEQTTSRSLSKSHAAMLDEWVTKKTKSVKKRNKAEAQAKARNSRASGSRQVRQPARRHLPPCDLQQVSLKPFCPPGGFIWKGNKSRNWNSHYKPFKRFSVTRAVEGMRGSAIKVLQDMWNKHAVLNDLKMPRDCPVDGVF